MVHNCPEYLNEAYKYIHKEEERVAYLLQPETKNPLMKVINEEVIERHAKILVDKQETGCDYMFKNSKFD
jgi:hypothetical protein